ncbi:MAG TPA: 5'-3' exonuclease H3TH domain-containing protein [Rudaea sp.]|nr:5'-3' exonuclease H3TH domain-containing protein [Rudaea sp.]
MQTVHLIDASLYVFRAWHSMPPDFHDADGAPVNAVHGFTRFLCDFLERTRPTHIAVAFDESLTSSFRNAIYPAYKANRELPPAELKVQFDYCKRVAVALGLCVLRDTQYEADDLIGSALTVARAHGMRSVIVSADKDFGQLIGDDDEQWDFSKDQHWDAHGVKQRLGVRPDQVVDYLALTGDAVDNIPGVPGVGAKTAAQLLANFDSLDALYARIEEVPYLRLRGAGQTYVRLKEHRAQAMLSRTLASIVLDAPVPAHPSGLARAAADADALDALLDSLRFGPLTKKRCQALRT